MNKSLSQVIKPSSNSSIPITISTTNTTNSNKRLASQRILTPLTNLTIEVDVVHGDSTIEVANGRILQTSG
jgi:hypothetical protein